MTEFKEVARKGLPVHPRGDIGDRDLENLADSLIAVLSVARYSQRYHPINEDELSTGYGKGLLSWLRKTLMFTPFGINYVCEDEAGRDIKVKLGNKEARKSKLYATAGIYALYHGQPEECSISTVEVGIIASFEDLIKVYSLKNRQKKKNPRWDDVGMAIRQKRGDTERWEYKSDKPIKSGRPIFYEHVIEESDSEILIKDLEFTGFPCHINYDHRNIICPVHRDSK